MPDGPRPGASCAGQSCSVRRYSSLSWSLPTIRKRSWPVSSRMLAASASASERACAAISSSALPLREPEPIADATANIE